MKEWILFDLDNTLLDFTQSAEIAFSKTLKHLGIEEKEQHLGLYEEVNSICWKQFENNEITAVEIRKRRFQMFFERIGVVHNSLEANTFYLNCIVENHFFIEGAVEVLEDLKMRGLKLAIITNGLKEVQRPRIAKTNLNQYFEKIIVSDEIGYAKPHHEFFEFTFNQIGFPDKEKTMVVGDSLHSDIKGGNNFELETCWFNPKNKNNNTEVRPHIEIENLSQIISLLS